jgi:hypothetical protein
LVWLEVHSQFAVLVPKTVVLPLEVSNLMSVCALGSVEGITQLLKLTMKVGN